MRSYTNGQQVLQAAHLLRPLLTRLVFMGGAALGLLITDEAAPDVRSTDDVDVIVKVARLGEYYQIEGQLRELGFVQRSRDSGPICRWFRDTTIIDVMPTDPTILGFGNRWYEPAIDCAMLLAIDDALEIRVISAPYFLATKIEAFQGRGGGDFLYSRDISDIITLVDGRPELVSEVHASPQDLQAYLVESLGGFTTNMNFIDAIQGHLLPDAASQMRLPLIMERIKRIVKL